MSDFINGFDIGDAPESAPAPYKQINGYDYTRIQGTVDEYWWSDLWDVYTFVAPTDGIAEFGMYGMGADVDIYFYTQTPNANFTNYVWSSTNFGVDPEYFWANLQGGGTYYLWVVPKYFDSWSTYTLDIDFADPTLLQGGANADTLTGTSLADWIQGRAGNDRLSGGGGHDIAIYNGSSGEFRFGVSNNLLTVRDQNSANGNEGTDQLSGVEQLYFDGNVRSFTVEGSGATLRVLCTADDDTVDVAGGGTLALDGRGGNDVAIFRGNAEDYAISVNRGVVTVRDLNTADGNDGVRSLSSFETLRFSDRDLAVTGGEFRINTTTAGDQTLPSIAALANGDYVVSWASSSADGSTYGAYAQRFSAGGVKLGAELRLDTDTGAINAPAAVAATTNGGFVAIWEVRGGSGEDSTIMARRYDANGSSLGQPFKVNQATASGNEINASIDALPGGGFVAAWSTSESNGTGYEVHTRRFDANGNAVGSELRVNTNTTGEQFGTSVTVLPNGNYVVAWLSVNANGVPSTWFQRFNASGSPLGSNTKVAVGSDSIQNDAPYDLTRIGDLLTVSLTLSPKVEALPDGGFAISASWLSVQAQSYGSSLHIFNANGSARYDPVYVSEYGSYNTAMTVLDSGEIVIAWSYFALDGTLDMYSRRFDSTGFPVRPQVLVNSTTESNQGLAAVEALEGGGYLVAWTSSGQDLNANGVYGQQYQENGNVVRVEVRGTDGDDVLFYIGDDAMRALGLKGDDVYLVQRAEDQAIEEANEGTDTIKANLSWTLGANLENLVLTGTGDDSGTGNGLTNEITGTDGANTIDGGAGADTLAGGLGNDTYHVDDPADLVVENAVGTSALGGPGGPGPQAGGTNIDTVISQVSYTLRANIENLELTGTANLSGNGNGLDNLLTGNSGNNLLDGKDGVDILDGGGGNDTMVGGAGKDTLGGGAGNDTYRVGSGDVLLENANEGTDTVESAISWTLADGLETLVLTGSANVDATGGRRANTLTGNGGNNLLNGKLGNDTLGGGAGTDTFVFDTALSANVDTITDFAPGSDRIRLDDDVFTALDAASSTTLASGRFYKAAGATGAADENDRIIYNTTNGALYYDADGTGTAFAPIRFATLAGAPATLGAGDFVISA